MKLSTTFNRFLWCGILLSASVLALPVSIQAWSGESWDGISRSFIENRAIMMMKNTWSPKNTISNFGYRSTYHTFSKGTTYTGVAYSQNNPQENWREFLDLVNNTGNDDSHRRSACSHQT